MLNLLKIGIVGLAVDYVLWFLDKVVKFGSFSLLNLIGVSYSININVGCHARIMSCVEVCCDKRMIFEENTSSDWTSMCHFFVIPARSTLSVLHSEFVIRLHFEVFCLAIPVPFSHWLMVNFSVTLNLKLCL